MLYIAQNPHKVLMELLNEEQKLAIVDVLLARADNFITALSEIALPVKGEFPEREVDKHGYPVPTPEEITRYWTQTLGDERMFNTILLEPGGISLTGQLGKWLAYLSSETGVDMMSIPVEQMKWELRPGSKFHGFDYYLTLIRPMAQEGQFANIDGGLRKVASLVDGQEIDISQFEFKRVSEIREVMAIAFVFAFYDAHVNGKGNEMQKGEIRLQDGSHITFSDAMDGVLADLEGADAEIYVVDSDNSVPDGKHSRPSAEVMQARLPIDDDKIAEVSAILKMHRPVLQKLVSAVASMQKENPENQTDMLIGLRQLDRQFSLNLALPSFDYQQLDKDAPERTWDIE